MRRAWLWFLATTASVMVFSLEGVAWGTPWTDAAVFAGALMGILGAHELAHGWAARRHGFAVSLPQFIPFPAAFGTMGAVIRLRSMPTTRRGLLEMAVAGPIGGALPAFACLTAGLGMSRGVASPAPGSSYAVFADPLVVRLLGTLLRGAPPDRLEVLHPLALAGWVGCMLTGINLLPIGQLDGGHVWNALAPRTARWISWAGVAALAAAGFAWSGWWVWAAVLVLTGAGRPLPVPDAPAPGMRGIAWGLVALALFVLTFMPVPIVLEQAP